MQVRLLVTHYATAGRGVADPPWVQGEVREVDEATAQYLLDTFPGWFEAVSVSPSDTAPVVTPAPAGPEMDRAMRPGRRPGRVGPAG